jgi:hypothetical protein
MPTATAGGMYNDKTCNSKRPRKVQNTKAVADTSGANTRSKQEMKDPGRSGLRGSFV